MITAAGIMFLTPGGKVLFLRRGNGSDHPNEWAFPGGQSEAGETPEQTAVREAREEAGEDWPDGRRTLWTRAIAPAEGALPASAPAGGELLSGAPPAPSQDVDFTTFLQRVPEEFAVTLCDESTGFAWASVDAPPEPLHPGARLALDRLSMDERGVAEAMAAGRLTSPQVYENMHLWAMRITGTGKSFRPNRNEHVWRDPSLYLNEEFLVRCAGLPVVLLHPEKKGSLDSDEFNERIVGVISVAYIKDDEVWGIAKVYDDATNEILREKRLSTSPGVVFRDPSTLSKYRQEDGSTLLIEGKPSLLDHLAICEVGVWDKGGPPAGIINDSTGEAAMAEETEEEKKAREDAARKDGEDKGEDGAKAMMDAASQLLNVCDEMRTRMDAMEEREKARDDAFSKRMDAMEAKKDAEGETEEEKKAREDAARKDEEEAEKERQDKARKDAEEEEERKRDDARKDSVELRAGLGALERTVRDIDRRTAPLSDADRAALSDAQSRADSVLSAFGASAPRAMQGESLGDYRRRLGGLIKARSSKFKEIDLAAVNDGSAFDYLEAQVYNDALETAHSPAATTPGELRAIEKRTPSGHIQIDWAGQPRDWMDSLACPGGKGMAIQKFLTN